MNERKLDKIIKSVINEAVRGYRDYEGQSPEIRQYAADSFGRGYKQSINNDRYAIERWDKEYGFKGNGCSIKRSGANLRLLDVTADSGNPYGEGRSFRYGQAYVGKGGHWVIFSMSDHKIMEPEEFFFGKENAVEAYYEYTRAIDNYFSDYLPKVKGMETR